jgi:hypothetical protein
MAPFEPLVNDIVLTRIPDSHGAKTVVVAQDNDSRLTLTVAGQPTRKLHPYQSRTFVINELEGFRVEFHLGSDWEADELIFDQPNGTLVAW